MRLVLGVLRRVGIVPVRVRVPDAAVGAMNAEFSVALLGKGAAGLDRLALLVPEMQERTPASVGAPPRAAQMAVT